MLSLGNCFKKYFHGKAMCSPIGVLWTLLSVIVAGLTAFSFLQPFWFINRDTLNSLGMYSYCIQDLRTKGSFTQVCGIYGGRFQLSNLPSNAWQVSCVLYGGGALLMCLSGLVAVITLWLPRSCDRRVAAFTGYVQTTGGKLSQIFCKLASDYMTDPMLYIPFTSQQDVKQK